ncbi:MAG: hypothetical protein HYT47_01890 [Candidatus Vogelbacteria bacterium]|nr:hypothetical protein [Candidatus Vogelbacteria bacterium]
MGRITICQSAIRRERNCLLVSDEFLQNKLRLVLHPEKIIVRKIRQGIDWLGYVVLPHYRVLRTRTERRIWQRLQKGEINQDNLSSYFGLCSHANTFKLRQQLLNVLS